MTLDLPAHRPFGPVARALEEHGCTFAIVSERIPGRPPRVRVTFPDDEYLEKKCRRILDEWREPVAAADCDSAPA